VYFTSDPRLVGVSYGQALLSYATSSPMGIRRADGGVLLNPPMNTRLEAGDQLIAISEDDDTVVLGEVDGWDPATVHSNGSAAHEPDHLLIVGWNDTAPRILRHLARAAAPGSTVDVVVDRTLSDVDEETLVEGLDGDMAVRLLDSDTTRMENLGELLGARTYERLVLLGYRDVLSAPEADARTLLTLVHARRLLTDGHRNAHTSIVAELLEQRSVELGRVANPDDFVVSERLTSLLIAQLAENEELAEVFGELLDGVGTEIVMQPLRHYLPNLNGSGPETVTYRELAAGARERGESAIGYTVPASSANDGVFVNPPKAATVPVADTTHLIVLRG
jgi:ion channel POLLUX/CASTOR